MTYARVCSWCGWLLVFLSLLPVFCVVGALTVARVFGCRVDIESVPACMVGATNIGPILSDFAAAIFFLILTGPFILPGLILIVMGRSAGSSEKD